jgi:hypothetical protein
MDSQYTVSRSDSRSLGGHQHGGGPTVLGDGDDLVGCLGVVDESGQRVLRVAQPAPFSSRRGALFGLLPYAPVDRR